MAGQLRPEFTETLTEVGELRGEVAGHGPQPLRGVCVAQARSRQAAPVPDLGEDAPV